MIKVGTGSCDRPSTDLRHAREIVESYGWNSTCFQIVNPGIEHWFGRGGRSVVGFVKSGNSRVVVGAPVCEKEDLADVADDFERDSGNGGGVCYFGAEARLESVCSERAQRYSKVLLGAQPVWDPKGWESVIACKRSLRGQLNRALNKGVTVREWSFEEADDDPRLWDCLYAWLDTKGLPPLHFVVEPATLNRLRGRRIFVAERAHKVIAFLVLSPVPLRNGWLAEQFPHHPQAPNGTVELMIDTAMRTLAEEGHEYLTLGLSPLSTRANTAPFPNPVWIRVLLGWMRRHGKRFYNFDGLDAFKAKLSPNRWEPVYAISNEPKFSPGTLYAIAAAFTDNKPVRTFVKGLNKAALTEISSLTTWIGRGFQ